MFRGINLCGAENNTTLSNRHRAHLFLLVQVGIISILRSLVKPQMRASLFVRGEKRN